MPSRTSPPRAGPGPETVEVSHPREVRGVWIATVWNINWPSATSLSAADQRAELDGLLDAAAAVGMNAVFLQIRAEGDAFYRSDLEPWSRFLSGTPGQDPGWDPLAHAVEAAHARGLELHAWMTPYRALVSGGPGTAAASHVVNARPDLVVRYGDLTWFDPGTPTPARIRWPSSATCSRATTSTDCVSTTTSIPTPRRASASTMTPVFQRTVAV